MMKALRALTLVLACALIGGVAGATIWYLIGTRAPGYYYAVFPGLERSIYTSTEFVTPLGFLQGVVIGLVVGLATLMLFGVRNHRFRLAKQLEDLKDTISGLTRAVSDLQNQVRQHRT